MDLKTLYHEVVRRLTEAGMESAELDARLLIKAVTGWEDADFITRPDITIGTEKKQILDSMVFRRLRGEPVSRIFGRRGFWGLEFIVTPDVLDPRADSETLIAAALRAFKGRPPSRILDLGTGSGCLIVTLLHEWPQTLGVAIDISPEALAVAARNAQENNVAERLVLKEGNWLMPFKEGQKFDLIISNPPYIPRADISNLDRDVRDYDPILALEGGIDGLESYQTIFLNLHKHIENDGIALFETGMGQAEEIVRLAAKHGLAAKRIHADLAGIPRVVEIARGDN